MRYLTAVILLSLYSFAQTANQPGVQYSSYTILLVSHQKGTEGVMVAIDKQKQIIFVPISAITKAVDEDGASPVSYGELLQLVRQLGEDNQRLKAENDHLWKVAEKESGASASVVVNQAAATPDPEADRRQVRTMLLRSLLAPQRSTVNVNVTYCNQYPALCAGR